MAIDETLLAPSREMIALLDAKIKTAEMEMVERIERWGKDDKEYARQQSRDYYAQVEPLRRERDYIAQAIADYYGLQPRPPQIIAVGQPPV
jgi:hypothetical protein